MKRLLILFLLFLPALIWSQQLSNNQDQLKVIISEFERGEAVDANLVSSVRDYFSSYLSLHGSSKYRILERISLNKVMAEHAVYLSGVLDEDNYDLDAAELEGADALFIGRVSSVPGNSNRINIFIRLVDINTGAVSGEWQKATIVDDLSVKSNIMVMVWNSVLGLPGDPKVIQPVQAPAAAGSTEAGLPVKSKLVAAGIETADTSGGIDAGLVSRPDVGAFNTMRDNSEILLREIIDGKGSIDIIPTEIETAFDEIASKVDSGLFIEAIPLISFLNEKVVFYKNHDVFGSSGHRNYKRNMDYISKIDTQAGKYEEFLLASYFARRFDEVLPVVKQGKYESALSMMAEIALEIDDRLSDALYDGSREYLKNTTRSDHASIEAAINDSALNYKRNSSISIINSHSDEYIVLLNEYQSRAMAAIGYRSDVISQLKDGLGISIEDKFWHDAALKEAWLETFYVELGTCLNDYNRKRERDIAAMKKARQEAERKEAEAEAVRERAEAARVNEEYWKKMDAGREKRIPDDDDFLMSTYLIGGGGIAFTSDWALADGVIPWSASAPFNIEIGGKYWSWTIRGLGLGFSHINSPFDMILSTTLGLKWYGYILDYSLSAGGQFHLLDGEAFLIERFCVSLVPPNQDTPGFYGGLRLMLELEAGQSASENYFQLNAGIGYIFDL